MVAREHRTGVQDISLGIFNFIDAVYRHALLIPVLCSEHGIGVPETWGELPEKQFLVYFRMNVPEEGKAFLREMFSEQPTKVKDHYLMIQFAAMTHHFHRIFGLGPAPQWTEREDLRAAKLYDVNPLINRPIRWAMVDPKDRASHFRSLEAARYALNAGALELLDKGEHGAAARLLVEGFVRANSRGQYSAYPPTLTLP